MLSISAPIAVYVFAFGMIQAAISDLTTMKIRNWLVLLLLAAYVLFAPLAGFATDEMLRSAGVALAVLLASFALFTRGWIGGGDAKLACVTTLWLGAEHTLTYLFYTAILGGALTVGLMLFRTCVLPRRLADMQWIARLYNPESGVPYGIAMAFAALLVFPITRWFGMLA